MKTLAQIQKNLKAPKGQTNKFGGYQYRSCEDILEALKPLLDEDDVFYLQDELVIVGERYYIKATARFNDKTTTAYAREADTKKGMDDSQVTGATSSYARKYALNALFAIDDTKDADATNDHGKAGGVIKGSDGDLPQGWTAAKGKKTFTDIKKEIEGATSLAELKDIWTSRTQDLSAMKGWQLESYDQLEVIKNECKEILSEKNSI
jgi:hypothetical protein